MMSNPIREVRWPFLVLLAVLLALSLIAPRQWRLRSEKALERDSAADGATGDRSVAGPAFDTLATDWLPRRVDRRGSAAVVAAGSVEDDDATDVLVAGFAAAENDRSDVAIAAAADEAPLANRPADISTHVAATETPAHPAVTGLPNATDAGAIPEWNDVAGDVDSAESTTPNETTPNETTLNETTLNETTPKEAGVETPSLAIRPASEPIDLPTHETGSHDIPHPVPIDVARDAARDAATWPMPVKTIERLRELARHEATRAWAGEMLCVFDDLRRGVAMSPEEFASTLGHMERLLAAGEALENRLAMELAVSSRIARTRWAVERRMDAWRSVYALHRVAGGDRLASRDPSSAIRIAPSAQAALADEAVALMDDIEIYEESSSPHTARKIALAARHLANHANATARQLGEHVDSNYRNANVRVAAHGELLNRFLPQPTETAGDVDEFVAGVPVYGTQRTRTRLLLRLLPDASNIRLGLEAHGEVDSDTAAHSGPATVFTTGETRFLARKLVLLNESRWKLFPAIAAARNDTSLAGVRTDFDPFPIINSLVHSVVRSQHEERRWSAEREVEDRVSQQAQARLDREANPKFSELTSKATAKLVEPLERLGLEPTPIALATTEERVIFRYRLAGGEQLGGHTPRPRAPGDSLLSVQLHESSINNALTNLDLSGRTFELRSLYESVATRLGRPDIKVPDDVPDEVNVTFAAENPLQVRLADNAAEITLRIDRLDAEGQTWRDLRVIATYEPQADGLDAVFARNVPIRLSGKNLTTRSNIVLRGVFSKMFTRNKQVHLLPADMLTDKRLAGLAVNQLVVNDGWAGLAIGAQRGGGADSLDSTVDSESASRGDGARR